MADFITLLVIAFFVSLLFSVIFRARRFNLNFLFCFLTMLLTGWASSLWIKPVGPSLGGISLIPVILVMFLIGLLLLAFHDSHKLKTDIDQYEVTREAAGILGLFFWIFILMMALPIILSYI